MSGSLAGLLVFLILAGVISLSWWTFFQSRQLWYHRMAVDAIGGLSRATERLEAVEEKSRVLERNIAELADRLREVERLLTG